MSDSSAGRLLVIHSNADYLVGLRLPLLTSISGQGYEVVALAPNMDESHRRILLEAGIDGHRCRLEPTGMNPFRDFRNLIALFRQIRQLTPQFLLTNTIKPVVFGTIAGTLARVPQRIALVSGLGYAFTDSGGRPSPAKVVARWAGSLLYALAFRLCRVVVFQNADDVREMTDAGICPREKASLVSGSGVDIDQFDFRKRTGPTTFIMVGRLLAEKGVRDYLEAARIAKEKRPELRFLLVGGADGNPSAIGEEELERYTRGGIVEQVSGVRDVRPWLYQASVFVLPSYREGVPRSSLEAMASGLAVITTDVPGCRETVIQGVNGLLVPVRDPAGLASAMLELAEDPGRIAMMGIQGRKIAEDRFDVRKVNEEMRRHIGLRELKNDVK